MKYAHLADLHLGSWRDQKMRDLSTKAFLTAIDQCVEQQVDFILFAGDLFNTSLPSLDTLKIVTKKLKELEKLNIPIYVIAGSHDFSPSGKTMVDVLENAGLLINVCKGQVDPETKLLKLKFTTDPKTGAKITGILGRKGQLDQAYYENLERSNLETESGYKIFMFHTTIAELLPKEMAIIESTPLSFLPKHFDYYAGGHIHHKKEVSQEGYKLATYPGALFPNNFVEVEKYSHGGYNVITVENDRQHIGWIPLNVAPHIALQLDCKHKNPEQIEKEIEIFFNEKDIQDAIITIRLHGKIESGKVSDINFKTIFTNLYEKGAYFIMKNTAKLHSQDFEEIKMAQSNPQVIEQETIAEHLGQINMFTQEDELHIITSLLGSLNTSKKEGETIPDFQRRVQEETKKILNM